MDNLKMHTPDLAAENFRKLAVLFPNAVTETINEAGEVVRAIDADVLRQEISATVVEGPQERYQFTWPDKKKSIVLANAPIAKTLRLDRSRSVGRDGTHGSIDSENIYIEGDNLDALKLLQETYLGKVKMIYIDPPYNTGSDFIYEDDFSQSTEEYLASSGQFDEDGSRLVQNTESNGRFHTDWLNMLYPRLRMAKDLLADDGVLFISLDDNESVNMVKICDEIFGAQNRIALICHKARASVSNDKVISPNHNTILFYAKKYEIVHSNRKLIGLAPDLTGFNLDDGDGKGPYKLVPVDGPGGAKKGNPYYEFLGVAGYFRFSKSTMEEKYQQGLVVKKGSSLYQKYYLFTAKSARKTATTWWDDAGLTSNATSSLKQLMGGAYFDNPKSLELISRMLEMITFDDRNALVMDFFSGSATTAHAVMQLNAEDGGNRKFIMVQLPEVTDEKSEAHKAGYKTICDIGEERIRRAGKKIIEDGKMAHIDRDKNKLMQRSPQKDGTFIDKFGLDLKPPIEKKILDNLDIGFRVFRVDTTNMEDVYYNPADYDQEQISFLANNIKPDRTREDLLFQVMLDLGILLSSSIEETVIAGKKVFSVAGGYLLACFDRDVTEETVTEIAKRHPFYAVFRDSSMANDSVATNFEQIFATYSPQTVRKVL